MELSDVLLNKEEVQEACGKFQQEHSQECTNYDCCSQCPVLRITQCLKLLEWLKEHDLLYHGEDLDGHSTCPDCEACELEKALRG